MKKTCTGCTLPKDTSEFWRKGKGHQPKCKECSGDWHRANYAQHRAHRIKLAGIRSRELRQEKRRLVNEAKSRPCADCKNEFPYYCMDFDHLDSTTKLDCLASMVHSKVVTVKTLIEEMAKCEVVCAICHRKRTHERSL